MKHPSRISILLIAALSALAAFIAPAARPQTTARTDAKSVTVVKGATRFSVTSLVSDQQVYVSMNALAKGLVLRTLADEGKGRLEVIFDAHRMRMLDANPYVIVSDRSSGKVEHVHNLPLDVIRTDKGWFVPLASFAPVLASVLGMPVAFDEDALVLTLAPGGKADPPSAREQTAKQEAASDADAGTSDESAAADAESQQKKPKQRKTGRAKWALDCIVIDAGHGGHDPGAIGTKGIREKNVTLGIALKLGALIQEHMPGVKVVYTRKDDTFIELYRRGQIANAAGGKLFVSIHCNSTEAKPSTASGFEVYLLRPGRTQEAIRIAEFENAVVKQEKDYEKRYQKLTDENFIIVSMAQSAYMKHSERFAEMLHETVKREGPVPSKGVKQAGFYVLVGASMPSVLIETGFISNKKEEALLASADGQQQYAETFLAAIQKFAKEYRRSLDE